MREEGGERGERDEGGRERRERERRDRGREGEMEGGREGCTEILRSDDGGGSKFPLLDPGFSQINKPT